MRQTWNELAMTERHLYNIMLVFRMLMLSTNQ